MALSVAISFACITLVRLGSQFYSTKLHSVKATDLFDDHV